MRRFLLWVAVAVLFHGWALPLVHVPYAAEPIPGPTQSSSYTNRSCAEATDSLSGSDRPDETPSATPAAATVAWGGP